MGAGVRHGKLIFLNTPVLTMLTAVRPYDLFVAKFDYGWEEIVDCGCSVSSIKCPTHQPRLWVRGG